jgi:hypothetical protein
MKKIPKSDISIRPFKVYKSYTATNADSGSGYERLFANHYLEMLTLLWLRVALLHQWVM